MEVTKERNAWDVARTDPFKSFETEAHNLTRELQDLMFVLLCFSLALVQSSLTVSPFFSSGMLMVFCPTVCWEDVTCFQNVEDVTVSEFIRCYCQEIVLGARGDFVLLDSCRCGSLHESHCRDWIHFFIVDHEPIVTKSECTSLNKQPHRNKFLSFVAFLSISYEHLVGKAFLDEIPQCR